ncbi:MAG: hypothetical protein IPK12_03340 [Gemmatimonadetes bacterium]|nr:hypothetical protein [Gemmatimonadota bacterium]
MMPWRLRLRAVAVVLALVASTGVPGPLAALQAALPPVVPLRLDTVFHPDPALELTSIRSILLLPGGDLLLTDYGTAEVLHLDARGKRLDPLARAGSGPGEARAVSGLGWRGDTLWAADPALNRLSFYSRALRFLRSEVVSERCGPGGYTLLEDGRCLVFVNPPSLPGPLQPGAWPIVLRGRGDRPGVWVEETLATYRVERTQIKFNPRDGLSFYSQPFNDQPLVPRSPAGRYVAVVAREATPEPRTVTVTVRDLRTGATRRLAVPVQPRPLSARSVDSALAVLIGQPHGPPWLRDSLVAKLYRPRFKAPVQGAALEDDGTLWLRLAVADGDSVAVYHRYDPSGALRQRVAVPLRVSVRGVDAGRVIGTSLDADEVPVLVRYLVPAR